jgi:alpha-N-arabinofuranosidase
MLRIVSRAKGSFKVGAVSLMPVENVNGMRPNTLSLFKQLNAPIYRWPGGNFVSGYNWLDGIGNPDTRPPRKNPAWTGIEHNDFGIHEFMTLCRHVNAEPLVVVNSGLGDANSAAKLVQYCNGDGNSPMGKLRTENGSPQPFGVKWWGIGNEMYGDWQLGHVPLEDYVKKHNEFADAMRAVDPSIKLIAVGSVGPWSQQMLTSCDDRMDLISEHFYCGLEGQSPTWQHTPLPIDQLRSRPERQRQTMLLKHVSQIPDRIKQITDAHRKYRTELDSLKDKDIRIAIDEYNYWYGPYLYGEIGTRFYLQDALGIAAGLHEIFRNSDIVAMANYAQTVNVLGAIKTTKISAALETTGLVLKMYRERFGQLPVEVSGQFSPLDVAAAWTKDKNALTIAVVNPTMRQARLTLDIQNIKLSGDGFSWQIAGSDPLAYNEPEFAPQVAIEEKQLTGVSKKFTVPPLSITIYKLMTTK